MLVPQGQFFQAGDERLDEKRGGNGGLKWVVSEIREQSLWTPSARRIREGRKGRPNRNRTLRSGEVCFRAICYATGRNGPSASVRCLPAAAVGTANQGTSQETPSQSNRFRETSELLFHGGIAMGAWLA